LSGGLSTTTGTAGYPCSLPRLRRRSWRAAMQSGVCAEARAGCVVAPIVVSSRRCFEHNGRSVSLLDIYRADFGDGSEGHGLMADARAQIERTGNGTPRPRTSGVVSVTGSCCAIPRSGHRRRAARRSTPTSLRRIGPAPMPRENLGDRRGYRGLIMCCGRLRRRPPGIAETVRK
jgi:hypothetical protein